MQKKVKELFLILNNLCDNLNWPKQKKKHFNEAKFILFFFILFATKKFSQHGRFVYSVFLMIKQHTFNSKAKYLRKTPSLK